MPRAGGRACSSSVSLALEVLQLHVSLLQALAKIVVAAPRNLFATQRARICTTQPRAEALFMPHVPTRVAGRRAAARQPDDRIAGGVGLLANRTDRVDASKERCLAGGEAAGGVALEVADGL